MTSESYSVAKQRSYGIVNTQQARDIARRHITEIGLSSSVTYGLPEIDDRYHIWRVPVISISKDRLGEVVIDAQTSFIDTHRTTKTALLESRLLKRQRSHTPKRNDDSPGGNRHNLRNVIIKGESQIELDNIPDKSVDLVFTSPPYFNARIEYKDYEDYAEYLSTMREVIRACHRKLADGRFFVINVAPVLIRRANRNEASKRIAVPFDMHRIFIEEGFDFIDDIHWVKPEGAGWATGRGRRFAADRNPLQYKAVPVTEYVLVYRKSTDHLIDWNIRNHPDSALVKESKIGDDYERTNLWRINHRHIKDHPAVFPLELAQKVISYYSFKGDVVLDPFAGSGTTGIVAHSIGRKFVLVEAQDEYIDVIMKQIGSSGLTRDQYMVVNHEEETLGLF